MITGFLIGYFIPKSVEHAHPVESSDENKHASYQQQLVESVDKGSLEELLRHFSHRPHIGGSEESHRQAFEIRDTWQKYGFDKVELTSYDVMLSYPQANQVNTAKIISNTGDVIYKTRTQEKVYEPSEKDPSAIPPFLAYSPSGNVTGDPVYANYGRVEDFKHLLSNGVQVKDRVVIMRYGRAYRGSMVANAYRYGAIGALIYTDPKKYAPYGTDLADTFPNTWWLPGDGVQRGTTLNGYPGDPLTPLFPSVPGAYRLKVNRTVIKSLPRIPCHAIGYDDAEEILARMSGSPAPSDWQGNLPITYRLGPGFQDTNLQLNMHIITELSINTTYDVIATITGREEPDRLVILGNHRDAWVFGAVDPVTATAATMETARGLSKLLNASWRPRRSIMLCSWGAEEHGIIGSTEWVEENLKVLESKAVVYLNMDVAVNGNFSFFFSSSPLLYSIINNTLKEILDPRSTPDKKLTLYDVMAKSFPSSTHPGQPNMVTLPSGSDFHSFYQYVGIPYADWGYFWAQKNFSFSYTGFPVYHTLHETFYWYKKFLDPRFELLRSVTQFCGLLLMRLSDSPLIPFTLTPYNTIVNRYFASLQLNAEVSAHSIDLQYLERAVRNLSKEIDEFEKKIKDVEENKNFISLRVLNDKLLNFERAFIFPYGIPGIPSARHVIFAPNIYDMAKFQEGTFPTIGNAMHAKDWDQVREQVTVVAWCVMSAAKVLAS
ncbi:N-acetylated-alpha-linked acidic dipeptidase 2 isoform X2 [Nematostella vectensis]|nr:N-acetylated-alpha-linked acidic dipeptidase 2 isoform X2 [Nematostella vectensis]